MRVTTGWSVLGLLPALLALFAAGCGAGGDPVTSSCLNACSAENACAGAKQQNCSSLCNARPSKCTSEFANYWTCAEGYPGEACSSYPHCFDAFSKLSNCLFAYCFAYPLDAACYYRK